jgi:hypothetical protein
LLRHDRKRRRWWRTVRALLRKSTETGASARVEPSSSQPCTYALCPARPRGARQEESYVHHRSVCRTQQRTRQPPAGCTTDAGRGYYVRGRRSSSLSSRRLSVSGSEWCRRFHYLFFPLQARRVLTRSGTEKSDCENVPEPSSGAGGKAATTTPACAGSMARACGPDDDDHACRVVVEPRSRAHPPPLRAGPSRTAARGALPNFWSSTSPLRP